MVTMIDLKKFPKLGVRVPPSLKRRLDQYVLDHEHVDYVNDKPMTLEGVFAVAVLDFLAREEAVQLAIIEGRVPELIALFEGPAQAPETETPAEGVAGGEGKPLPGGGRINTVVPESPPPDRKGRRRKAGG